MSRDIELELSNGLISPHVDLKNTNVIIKILGDNFKNLDVERTLAILLSITVLHVLLQPKFKPALGKF